MKELLKDVIEDAEIVSEESVAEMNDAETENELPKQLSQDEVLSLMEQARSHGGMDPVQYTNMVHRLNAGKVIEDKVQALNKCRKGSVKYRMLSKQINKLKKKLIRGY